VLGHQELAPRVITVHADISVHALHPATLRTGPSLAFRFDEGLDARAMDELKVLEHTHPVLGAVSLVKASEASTRKRVALEAEARLAGAKRFALADSACENGLRLAGVPCPAPSASVLLP